MKIALGPEDSTIFAECPVCCRRGKGVPVGDIYAKAYTPRRWKRGPECENCSTLMVKLFEIEVDET